MLHLWCRWHRVAPSGCADPTTIWETMKDIRLTIAERVAAARERAGLGPSTAARLLDIDRVRLAGMEKGERPIEASMLLKLAQTYGTTVSHLIGEGGEPGRPQAPAVRLRANVAEQLGDAEHQAHLQPFFTFCERHAKLRADAGRGARPLDLPLPAEGAPSAFRKYAIEGDVANLREHWGLGDGSVGLAIFDLLEDRGLIVDRRLLPTADISGAFAEVPDLGVALLVNTRDHPYRQVFTAAHELAHAIYHRRDHFAVSYKGDQSSDEKLANQFASAFLMPEMGVKRYLAEHARRAERIDAATAIGLQRHFGVSYAAMLVRLKTLNILRGEQYDELKAVQPVREALRFNYPVHSWEYRYEPEEVQESLEALKWKPREFFGLTLQALHEGRLTERQAARYLDVNPEVLGEYLLFSRSIEDLTLGGDFEDAEASVV